MRRILFTLLCFIPLFPALLSIQAPAAGAETISLYERSLLEQINAYRAEHKLPALRFDARLNQLAREHSFTMSRQKRISHLDFRGRFQRSGSRLCVENVGTGNTYALKQFRSWQSSSAHDGNLLNANILRAGIAEIGTYVTFFACQ